MTLESMAVGFAQLGVHKAYSIVLISVLHVEKENGIPSHR